MSVVKEWKCAQHGAFECSDPICPEMGCRSDSVEREFRTPPGVRTRMVKQHDEGIRGLSDRMGGVNFRSAKEGEAAFGGDAGKALLWGNDARKFLGHEVYDKTLKTDAMRSAAAVATRQHFVDHDLRPPVHEVIQHASDSHDKKRVLS